jgi:hypothetical protein
MLSFLPRVSKSWNYNSLKGDEPLMEKNREEEEQILRQPQTRWRKSDVILGISNILFASLSFYLYLALRHQRVQLSTLGSYETGWTTEMAAVKPEIALEQRMFYGAPRWNKEGVGSLLLDPNDRIFVGDDYDHIDDNWEDFIGGKC